MSRARSIRFMWLAMSLAALAAGCVEPLLEGQRCGGGHDCASGYVCAAERCVPAASVECVDDQDCPVDARCGAGTCIPTSGTGDGGPRPESDGGPVILGDAGGAGIDAGGPREDAGAPPDAGGGSDAGGATDAGGVADAGGVVDAGNVMDAGTCGDGVLAIPEQCDIAPASLTECDEACRFLGFCGDGVLDAIRGETCEPTDGGPACTDFCREPTCGDGIRQAGEVCEPFPEPLADLTDCTSGCGNPNGFNWTSRGEPRVSRLDTEWYIIDEPVPLTMFCSGPNDCCGAECVVQALFDPSLDGRAFLVREGAYDIFFDGPFSGERLFVGQPGAELEIADRMQITGDIALVGMTVKGSPWTNASEAALLDVRDGGHLRLYRTTIGPSQRVGIRVREGGKLSIDGVIIEGNASGGLEISGAAASVQNSIVANNQGFGGVLLVGSGVFNHNTVVYNTTTTNGPAGGVTCDPGSMFELRGNLVWFNGTDASASSECAFSRSNVDAAPGLVGDNIRVAPELSDSPDTPYLNLNPEAGVDLIEDSFDVTHDFRGYPRGLGARSDIGAYELP